MANVVRYIHLKGKTISTQYERSVTDVVNKFMSENDIEAKEIVSANIAVDNDGSVHVGIFYVSSKKQLNNY